MFRRTITCGSPVVAESWRTYSSGVCGRLAERQRRGHEPLGRPRRERHQLAHGERRERRAHRLLRFLEQVAPDEAGVGLAQLDERLAGPEVDDPSHVDDAVGPPAAQHGQVQHQYTPSTTVAAKPRNGRTLRTPSQG